jgi:hypothetical protein
MITTISNFQWGVILRRGISTCSTKHFSPECIFRPAGNLSRPVLIYHVIEDLYLIKSTLDPIECYR